MSDPSDIRHGPARHDRVTWEAARRKRAERALRAIVEGTAALTGDELFRSVVRNVATVFGASHAFLAERIKGRRVRMLAHWQDDAFVENIEYDVAGLPCEFVMGGNVHFEPSDLREKFPDSSLLRLWDAESFLGMPIRSSSGRVLGHIGVIGSGPMDADPELVSILETFAVRVRAELERAHAEEALGQSEDRYRALYEDNPSMYFTLDRDGTVVSVNEFGAQQLGYTVDELLGRPVTGVFHVEDRAEVERQLQRSIAQPGRVFRWRFRKIHRKGPTLWVEEFARTVKDADGKTRTLIVCQDITDRIRAEKDRHRLEEKVQQAQKLESLGVLAGGVAHDFNNLLAVILGNADLSLTDAPSSWRARANIEEIKVAAKRAAELCQQMLTYSGKSELKAEAISLNDVVREISHLMKVSVSKKSAVRIDVGGDIPAIRADATQVRQILMNLITNASEAHQDEVGTIRIETGTMECDEEFLKECFMSEGCSEGTYVYLDVVDEGMGMAPETVRRIFDPFFTTKFTGRGLGLAAVMGVVHGHRAAIRVDTELGAGTTVRVLFPSLGHPVRQSESEDVEPTPWGGSGTVLIVDDEEMVRRMGRQMLEGAGFTVLTAANGREAVEIFEEAADEIRCVILDVTMPQLSGEEALQELRAIRADVPVILASGHDAQEISDRFRGRETNGFIHKPFTVKVLVTTLKRVLEREARREGDEDQPVNPDQTHTLDH